MCTAFRPALELSEYTYTFELSLALRLLLETKILIVMLKLTAVEFKIREQVYFSEKLT